MEPSARGKIFAGAFMAVVFLGAIAYLPSTSDQCASLRASEQIFCYTDSVREIVQEGGLESAVTYIENEVSRHADWGSVHLVMHSLGHIAYAETNGNLEEALSYIPDLASEEFLGGADGLYDGYSHGLLQAFFAERIGDPFINSLSIACPTVDFSRDHKEFREGGEYGRTERCLHAVGHGLMYALGNSVRQSLSFCKEINDFEYRYWCAMGVYMENAYLFSPKYSADADRPNVTTDAMVSLCEEAGGDDFYAACANYVGRAHLAAAPGDFEGAFAACLELSKENERCINNVAQDRLPAYYKNNLSAAIQMCEALPNSYAKTCLLSVVQGVRRGSAGHQFIDSADVLCARIRALHDVPCEKGVQ